MQLIFILYYIIFIKNQLQKQDLNQIEKVTNTPQIPILTLLVSYVSILLLLIKRHAQRVQIVLIGQKRWIDIMPFSMRKTHV